MRLIKLWKRFVNYVLNSFVCLLFQNKLIKIQLVFKTRNLYNCGLTVMKTENDEKKNGLFKSSK